MSSTHDRLSNSQRPHPSGDCFISRLPVELLTLVFQHLANADDLEQRYQAMRPDDVYKLAGRAGSNMRAASATCKWFHAVSRPLMQFRTVILSKPEEHRHFLRTIAQKPGLASQVMQLIFFEPPQPRQPALRRPKKRKRSRRPWYEPKSKPPRKLLDLGPLQERAHSEEVVRLSAVSSPERYSTRTRDSFLDLLDLLRHLPRLVSFRYVCVRHPHWISRMAYHAESDSDWSATSFQDLFSQTFAAFTPAQLGNMSDHPFYHLQELHLSGIHTYRMLHNVLQLPRLKTLRISPPISGWTPGSQPALQHSSIRELYIHRISHLTVLLPDLLSILQNLEVVNVEFSVMNGGSRVPRSFEGLNRHRTTLRELHHHEHGVIPPLYWPVHRPYPDFSAYSQLANLTIQDCMFFDPPGDRLRRLPLCLESLTINATQENTRKSLLPFLADLARHASDFSSLRQVKVENMYVDKQRVIVKLEKVKGAFASAGVAFEYMIW
ncbi:uncharacterized protein DSM5745_03738 [Aspergillus mulundensis]|uniref:F-box domain-containing protein n=1 Tax=Aspergillus mulundensis TaxID=1810919 RepID=A0A3D8SLE1_9EURO|nr:hypothetical protein DSM5745_03738 [Aspergillus mulundensis]RDW87096.1 hypothetical protein DSM5745_03738 [Aspergillus mulundensis]